MLVRDSVEMISLTMQNRTGQDSDRLVLTYRISSQIEQAAKAYSAIPKLPNLDSRLDALDDRIHSSAFLNVAQSVQSGQAALSAAGVITALSSDPKINAFEKTITTFSESSKILMNALDEVAKVHPFIAVAVLAFKTAINLELTRRDNDRKIGALKVKMADMMSVLLQLRTINDPTQVGQDQRFQDIIAKAAIDIQDCAKACDAYVRKKLIVKVLKSSIWDAKLADLANRFVARCDDISFALSIHTSLTVDNSNKTLLTVNEGVQSSEDKIDMLVLFRCLESPRERELMKFIDAKGGAKKCMEDDRLFREIVSRSESKESATGSSATHNVQKAETKGGTEARLDVLVSSLREDLNTDWEVSLKQNRAIFDRKFDAQRKQLAELKETVVRESDRVIAQVIAGPAGPQDRVVDKDLHDMWQDMVPSFIYLTAAFP